MEPQFRIPERDAPKAAAFKMRQMMLEAAARIRRRKPVTSNWGQAVANKFRSRYGS